MSHLTDNSSGTQPGAPSGQAFECEQTLLVQADFDGELDAAQSAALIQHLAQCPHCQAAQAQLARSRDILRKAPRHAAPAKLREAVMASARAATSSGPIDASDRASAASDGSPGTSGDPYAVRGSSSAGNVHAFPARRRASRAPVFAWVATAAAAAVVATVLLVPRSNDISDQLVSSHLRALQLDSHLIDVVSTDHHTVKPWFAGKVDFAPIVKQMDGEGYVLKGGRTDVVGDRTAAVLVYQVGKHIVEVYMWPQRAGAGSVFDRPKKNDGFNLRQWNEGDLVVWCISDMAEDELDRFAERFRRD